MAPLPPPRKFRQNSARTHAHAPVTSPQPAQAQRPSPAKAHHDARQARAAHVHSAGDGIKGGNHQVRSADETQKRSECRWSHVMSRERRDVRSIMSCRVVARRVARRPAWYRQETTAAAGVVVPARTRTQGVGQAPSISELPTYLPTSRVRGEPTRHHTPWPACQRYMRNYSSVQLSSTQLNAAERSAEQRGYLPNTGLLTYTSECPAPSAAQRQATTTTYPRIPGPDRAGTGLSLGLGRCTSSFRCVRDRGCAWDGCRGADRGVWTAPAVWVRGWLR